MINSAIAVHHLSSGQLQLIAPPSWLSSLPFILSALGAAVFLVYRSIKSSSFYPLLGICIFCAPFFLAGIAGLRNGSVLLDKTANTATITKPSWFWHETFTIPLSDIQRAELHSFSSGTSIALVLQDGNSMGFFDFTDQSGQGHAAQAINDYLGVPRR